jgi:hypothetical protein
MTDLTKPARFSVIFHNYYGHHQEWVRFLCERIAVPFNLFYNVVDDSFYNLEDEQGLIGLLQAASSGTSLRRIILRRSPNQGKDIGGKLVLLDACLREKIDTEYQLFLHDKKSPHKAEGRVWQEKLFRIADPVFVEGALANFAENASVGIIASADSVMNEFDPGSRSFSSTNGRRLQELRAEYSINTADYRYVAGTMFWVRWVPMLAFFQKHSPLQIRKTLEKGNIMDEKTASNTHSWERLLSWLIFAQGYTIRGI